MTTAEIDGNRPNVFLNTYHGVGQDLLTLNRKVVDEFIDWADLRYDVMFQSSIHYSPIDTTQLTKTREPVTRIPMPHRGLRTRYTSARKEGACWVVSVEDQAIAENI